MREESRGSIICPASGESAAGVEVVLFVLVVAVVVIVMVGPSFRRRSGARRGGPGGPDYRVGCLRCPGCRGGCLVVVVLVVFVLVGRALVSSARAYLIVHGPSIKFGTGDLRY